MKTSLQFRLSQHLALTPQLQQSIRLLQLSTLELQQEIGQMLEQNPFLEPDEDHIGLESAAGLEYERQRSERNTADQDGAHADSGGSDAAEAVGLDGANLGSTERDDWENGTERDDFDGIREMPSSSGNAPDSDDHDPLERNSSAISLQ